MSGNYAAYWTDAMAKEYQTLINFQHVSGRKGSNGQDP